MCGEQLPHVGVERELSSFDQLQDGGGRDGLGEARDAEQSAGLNRLLSFLVCQAEAARIHETAVLVTASAAPGTCCSFTNLIISASNPASSGCAIPEIASSPGDGCCA
jgi:hypothetical protein